LKRIAIWGIGAIALALVAASCIRKQINEQTLAAAPQIAAKPDLNIQLPVVTPADVTPAIVTPPVAKLETPAVVESAPATAPTSVNSNSVTTKVAAPVPAIVKAKPDIATAPIAGGKPAIKKPVAPTKQVISYKTKRQAAVAKNKRALAQRKAIRKTVAATRACSAKPGQKVVQSVCFATNSAVLSNESKRKLSVAAQQIKTNANQRLEVAGFTDGSGNNRSNIQLSERRSQAVVNYLIAQGVDRALLTNKGYGEESAKRAQQHRRVDLKVIQP
jgi:outer membrane protein OmpA-like peptidoglycan-associated protein